MRVRVVLYGGLKREAGWESETVELGGEAPTVRELADNLRERYHALNAHLGSVAYAVGDEIVSETRALKEGDEVGLLPPVSGG